MKIYPSNHKIKTITTSRVDTDLNIPLAYMDIDYKRTKHGEAFTREQRLTIDTITQESINKIMQIVEEI